MVSPELRARALVLLVSAIAAYGILIVGGYLLLRSEVATVRGNELGPDRALFAAVNAVTLTGFQQSLGIAEYRPAGQMIILALTIGGSLVSLIVGGRLVSLILRLPYRSGQIATAAILLHAIAIFAGGMFARAPAGNAFVGMFHGVSALANSGLAMNDLPGPDTASTQLLLLPLGVVGGLGITVLLELWSYARHRRPLSKHAVVVLAGSAAIYLIGTVLIAIAHVTGGTPASDALIAGTTWTLNSRTIGLPFDSAGSVARTVQWIVLLLMMIGAASGSAAGGIKLTTLAVLGDGVRSALRGKTVPRIVGIGGVWFLLYVGVAFISFLLLLWLVPQLPADRLLFIAVSAMSNAGLSHDPLAIVRESLYLLSATMMLGKVLPLLILAWTARSTSDADIAVG